MPSGSGIEVPFEPRANARPRTVQQHALVLGGDAERIADSTAAAAHDVAERDHDLLALGQLLDRVLDELEGLRRDEALLGKRAPVGRVRAPVAGVRIVRAAE